MTHKIIDIHAHVVPSVDDGATSLPMAISLLKRAYEQGARAIVCTSHSYADIHMYKKHLNILRKYTEQEKIGISLYSGCEINCSHYSIKEIVRGLNNKTLLTINNTKYVLIEFNPYEPAEKIVYYVMNLRKYNYNPILAHVERYQNLFNNKQWILILKKHKCLFQINAYSLQDETNIDVKSRARYMLLNRYVSFIGSDVHRINHRTYAIKNGVEYVYRNCEKDYADAICYKNATKMLNIN